MLLTIDTKENPFTGRLFYFDGFTDRLFEYSRSKNILVYKKEKNRYHISGETMKDIKKCF